MQVLGGRVLLLPPGCLCRAPSRPSVGVQQACSSSPRQPAVSTARCFQNKKKSQRGGRRANLRVHAEANGNGAAASDVTVEVENLVIIGSGPAGYTAAIYAARANLRPFVFEGLAAGGVPGGQLMTTTEVENFPGFPEGVTGPELMERMRSQAERWGSRLYTEDVEEVDLTQRPFLIRGSENTVRAHSVIIATGATAKRLGIPSESRFWSAGISACAICDGASPIFKNQEVAVVGGGDTACEEAVYLTKYASHVHLLVRSPKLRASGAMADRALNNPKVTVHFSTGVEDALPDAKGAFGGLRLKDTASGETRDLPVRGLFYGIGHQPNSGVLGGQIELDEAGYVKVLDGCKTNVEGVFAAGDIHDTEWRQAVTAAGSGCMAALSAERYLTAKELSIEYHTEARPAHAAPAASSSAPSRNGNGAQPADDESTFDVSATRHRGQYALRRLYHESPRLMAVLYTSPTCGPCKTLKPIFNKVVEEYGEKVHLVEICIEEDPEIAQAAGVNGTPTIQMFKNKDRVENLPGVKMKREYRQIIEAHV